MPLPTGDAPIGCPPGLEYLTQIDQILVNQQIELLECKLERTQLIIFLDLIINLPGLTKSLWNLVSILL